MIEITEGKAEELSEHIEKSLQHMGRAMSCVEQMMEGNGNKHRSKYGDRYYPNRKDYIAYRDDEDWDDEDDMGERRRRSRRTGRYM